MHRTIERLYYGLLEEDGLKAEMAAREALRQNNLPELLQQIFSIYKSESSTFFERLMQLPSMILDVRSATFALSRWHELHPRSVCEWLSSFQSRGFHSIRSHLLSHIKSHRLRADVHDLLGDSASCVFVPAGHFMMGSPTSEMGHRCDEVQRYVTINTPLIVAKTPVTKMQWYQLMLTNPPFDFSDLNFSEDDIPATITWFDAVAYCNALSLIMDLPEYYRCENEQGIPGFYDNYSADFEQQDTTGYRLPTEEEWEYFCRAGTTGTTYYGNFFNQCGQDWKEEPALDPIAWYYDNSGREIHPVGQKLPNPWGLWDTIGNVCEWCWNAAPIYSPEYSPEEANLRVARGGSAFLSLIENRAAARQIRIAGKRYFDSGVRFVRSVP